MKFQCQQCGKEFKDYKCRKDWRRTCSRSCLSKLSHTGRKKSPIWKHIDELKKKYGKGMTFKELEDVYGFHASILSRVFGTAKIPKRRTGIREAEEVFYRAIRQLSKYKSWRKLCFERDGGTCVLCKRKDRSMHVDHFPSPLGLLLKKHDVRTREQARECKELWDLKLGRTLCIPCHRKTDSWGRHISRLE